MAYNKQNFETGWTLTADMLNTIEDGIVAASNAADVAGTLAADAQSVAATKQNNLSSILNGKVCSILGDSISTFRGYIPTDHVFNGEVYANPATYPSRDVTAWTDTWWGQIISKLGMTLGVNDSWSGSRVHNSSDSDLPASNVGPNVCMAGLQRIQKLGTNGTPDVIFVYGGTNDAKFVNTGTFDSSQVYSAVDLTTTKWSDFAASYVAMIMRLQHFYPDAILVALKPMFVSSWYDHAKLSAYCAVIEKICDYFGVICIDLRKSGINYSNISSRLPDGLHPGKAQMTNMANYIMSRLASELRVDSGTTISTTVPVTALTTTTATSLSVEAGNTVTFGIGYTPSNTTQRGVTWSSSSTSIATVSSSGVVTGVSAGTATITASSIYNSSIKKQFFVTVTASTSGGEGGGGGDDSGTTTPPVETPTSTTWYVDFTDEKPNFDYKLSQQPGFAYRVSSTMSKITGVPINAVKAYIGDGGQFSVGRGFSDGSSETLCSVTLTGDGTSWTSTQTIVLPETIVINEGEYFIIGRGVQTEGNNGTIDSCSIGVKTGSAHTDAFVKTGFRTTNVTSDENWSGCVGIGYAVFE